MAEWKAIDCAKQYLGMKEVPGHQSNPAILAMLKMDMQWPKDDATPWCSAFANWVAFNMGLERTKSLRARSWLTVGTPVSLDEADGNTVVIFSRGRGKQPGPEVINAPGHVAFFSENDSWTSHKRLQSWKYHQALVAGPTVIDMNAPYEESIYVVGGNQGDKVSEKHYPIRRVLGYRKLARLG